MADINKDIIREIVKQSGLNHIAFIMDGNGRWAKSRGLPREFGHRAGAENFKKVVRYCRDIGIKIVTVYAFSTENIKRPKREVDAIFKLLMDYIDEAREEEAVEFRFIGDPWALGEDIGKKAAKLEEDTRGGTHRINIALNYGGRAEIVHAVNRLIAEGKSEITEDDISARIYTSDCPDPDLVVRTGRETRISNFLLWQSAYSEFYFSDAMWPDFSPDDVNAAVRDFAGRSRRWGGLDKNESAK
ncbi:MAG: di-trans,poly-cis-decaprenylcistransferase [Clostridia bacterium]|nr:di-trans,poly-cis-decaprenylcistransferase [Clostridia bacterium]